MRILSIAPFHKALTFGIFGILFNLGWTSPSSRADTCQINFGWGNTVQAKLARDHAPEGELWVVQGCNIGESFSSPDFPAGRYQIGPNGKWARRANSRSMNGGLNPLDLNKVSAGSLDLLTLVGEKNSSIGFIRLTQFTLLDIARKAEQRLLATNQCHEVEIRFHCLSPLDGQTSQELQDRWTLATRPLLSHLRSYSGVAQLLTPTNTPFIETLDHWRPLVNCIQNETHSEIWQPYPQSCGQIWKLKKSFRWNPNCLAFMNAIDRLAPLPSFGEMTERIKKRERALGRSLTEWEKNRLLPEIPEHYSSDWFQ